MARIKKNKIQIEVLSIPIPFIYHRWNIKCHVQ